MYLQCSVLLVDDHSPSREMLKEVLQSRGAQVVGEARTTDDALDKFEALQPDTVIIDICLPGSWDPLVAIRQMKRIDPTCVVLVTGTPSQNLTLMEALTMGAADFFMKPYHTRTVELCLQKNVC